MITAFNQIEKVIKIDRPLGNYDNAKSCCAVHLNAHRANTAVVDIVFFKAVGNL